MYTLNMSTACAVVNTILSSLTEDIMNYLGSKIDMLLSKTKKSSQVSNLFSFAMRNNEENSKSTYEGSSLPGSQSYKESIFNFMQSQKGGSVSFSVKYTVHNAILIAYLNTFQV